MVLICPSIYCLLHWAIEEIRQYVYGTLRCVSLTRQFVYVHCADRME